MIGVNILFMEINMNFLINIFYSLFRKHEDKGVLFSLWLTTVALVFNLFVLIHFTLYVIDIRNSYDVIYSALMLLPFFYIVSNLLEKKYIINKKFYDLKLTKWIGVAGIFYLLASVLAFPISFKWV